MAKKPKRTKVRTAFKKRHQSRGRASDLTRRFQQDALEDDDLHSGERVSGKGDLTRHRTVIGPHVADDQAAEGGATELAAEGLLTGRVIRVHGLECVVRTESEQEYRCAVRQVLKSISTDQRHVVAAGDLVRFRPENEGQGLIVAVLPRHGVLCRSSRGRRHVLVTNIDLVVIVASARQPDFKPHLIDRYLVTAEQASLEPVIVINKADLIEGGELMPAIGTFAQLGYVTLLTSAARGWGIEGLKQIVTGRQSVVTGQSGVGKSSLLNCIQDGLGLRVQPVSSDNSKGKHTTTTSELIPLAAGGYFIDTPGIRQLELWDVSQAEVAGLYRDIRPYVSHCRFPNCMHVHEADCAVREAVADGRVDARRYDSYVHLIEDPQVAH